MSGSRITADGACVGIRVIGLACAYVGTAERVRYSTTADGLGAVVFAAGEGELGGVWPVRAGLVRVVGLIIPVAIVEVLVVIGDLVASQPVDGYALVCDGVRSACVVPGIDGRCASNYPEVRAVGLDVGVARRGEVLHEGVVILYVGGGGVPAGGREE